MTFIAVEGIDGAGKTTLCARLASALSRLHPERSIIQTREPYRLSAQAAHGMSPARRFAAFLQDRSDHVEMLADDLADPERIIITDRYYMSTAAYQGGVESAALMKILSQMYPEPDLWVMLTIDPTEARRRCEARGAAWDWPTSSIHMVQTAMWRAYLRAPGDRMEICMTTEDPDEALARILERVRLIELPERRPHE